MTTDPVETWDVVILGGGINGCGTFRDLCAQGVKCLLIERDDFCAGASQGSSRLMHGGLKYLETGEFRLVRESATERNMLLQTAPHYVTALPCIVPVRSYFGGIIGSAARFLRINAPLNDRGFAITALGLALYDFYGRKFRALPRHKMLTARALRRDMPDLDPGLKGAGLYYEAQISQAERLGLELVLDGEALQPASLALNHATLLGAADGVIHYHANGRDHAVQARVVVNAGGAWIDKINADLGIASQHMGGSRGAHVVVRHPALLAALKGRMVYFGTADGRVNLLYPLGQNVLIGSTDIANPDPDTATCTPAEAAYLCATVAEIFPGLPVTEDQIVYRYSGVRPLPRSGASGAAVTRDHSISTDTLPGTSTPVLCLIGGKWTTFRGFSETVTDAVLAHLNQPRQCSTAGMPIGGGRDFPRTAAEKSALLRSLAQTGGLTLDRAAQLLARYGTRAALYCASLNGAAEIPLQTLPDYSQQEIAHLIRFERAQTAEDLLRRRTSIALDGDATPQATAEIALLLDAGTQQTARFRYPGL